MSYRGWRVQCSSSSGGGRGARFMVVHFTFAFAVWFGFESSAHCCVVGWVGLGFDLQNTYSPSFHRPVNTKRNTHPSVPTAPRNLT